MENNTGPSTGSVGTVATSTEQASTNTYESLDVTPTSPSVDQPTATEKVDIMDFPGTPHEKLESLVHLTGIKKGQNTENHNMQDDDPFTSLREMLNRPLSDEKKEELIKLKTLIEEATEEKGKNKKESHLLLALGLISILLGAVEKSTDEVQRAQEKS